MRLFLKIIKVIPTLLGLMKDEEVSFSILTRLGKLYLPTYKFTWPEIDWFHDKELNKILEKMILANPDNWIWSHNRWK